MKVIAFVIGNDKYSSGAELNCAVNDAKGVAEVFRRLGYDVFERLNCTTEDCTELLKAFDAKIKDYDASIFYYAGHGFEVEGENYLASIDCQVSDLNKHACNRTCIRLTEVLDILKKNREGVNIIIIDACRKSFERSGLNKIAPIQAPAGTLIAFSTSPNEGASDGGGQNNHSVYTATLLDYIKRETLPAEQLFKAVRKTVYNLTNGNQITWEHTSLIGDFVFNSGQMVYSVEIPYDEIAVKDALYDGSGDFGCLIAEFRSYNWYRQNDAVIAAKKIPASELDKNQQFVLGRNLYQACCGGAFEAQKLFDNLHENLSKYSEGGVNHVLNGILFEIYFDRKGSFRSYTKGDCWDKVFALRKNSVYKQSFEFIGKVLQPYRDQLIYVPSYIDENIDVDISLGSSVKKTPFSEEQDQVIEKVCIGERDISKEFSRYCPTSLNERGIKEYLSKFLTAPTELIMIHSNTPIEKLQFSRELFKEDLVPLWG